MSLKSDLPASMEAAALLDLANGAVKSLLERRYPRRTGVHASDLTDPSGNPFRKISARRLMLQGWYTEAKYVDLFREAGVLIFPGASTPPANDYGIAYTPDAVIRLEGAAPWKDEGWRTTDRIVEIKSVGSEVWKAVQQHEYPFPKHYLRTRLYLYLSGVGRAWLLYENRDTLEPWIADVGPLSDKDREELDAYLHQKADPLLEEVDE